MAKGRPHHAQRRRFDHLDWSDTRRMVFPYRSLYYYLQLLKFGFGRAARDASRLIQQSSKNYNDIKDDVSKFDREVPTSDIIKYCDYISISLDEFNDICNKHRDNEIWKFKGNEWKLNNEV